MNTTDNTALQDLKDFLNKLFQFESLELDFGIYKILHYKRHEIKHFIDELLVTKAKQQLQTLSSNEVEDAQKVIVELAKSSIIGNWLQAKANADMQRIEIFEKDFSKEIHRYKEVERLVKMADAIVDAERLIYNHLTTFFSRYYDKGDFVSKRRFGKNEKYVVPYNGEETHFYWANNDQYYIKSSEHFQKYSFKIKTTSGTLLVNFKLAKAETEQGNVKADDNKYFVRSNVEPQLELLTNNDEVDYQLNIYFEFRALTDVEKKKLGTQGKQDKLNELVITELEPFLRAQPITFKLLDIHVEQTLLQKHLNKYTRLNKYDFFIHRNLKDFLQRELDFYIKSELVKVDDLYVFETELYFDRIRQNFRTIKVFKYLADTIIEFLAQIEEFQKKLWEKKKFVLSTEWVITVDKLIDFVGEEAAKPFLTEVIQNQQQRHEWLQLFGEKKLPQFDAQKPRIQNLKHGLHDWRKLPVDTKHFTSDFKYRLLNLLSEHIDLEPKTNGLVIHSDNYHGLTVLSEKFHEQIKCVYIDPPYNTEATEITYKNGYKHSSWNALIENRLKLGRNLGKKDGLHCITIDDAEYNNLFYITEKEFGRSNHQATVVIRNNPSGRSTVTGFSINHEYALFFSNSESVKEVGKLPHNEKQIERYNETDNNGNKYEWENLRRNGPESNMEDRPKQYYPIVINRNKNSIRLPNMCWQEEIKEWQINENVASADLIYPIHPNGVKKVWRYSKENIENEPERFKWIIKDGNIEVYRKKYLNSEGFLPRTWWDNPLYSARDNGTRDLVNFFNKDVIFDFPKAVHAIIDSLKVCKANNTDLILDYFAGSGTTFHATQLLNKEDSGNRKCILIEQGDYTYTVIIPRIKKIAYTFDWKDGYPKDDKMNGLGVFFKYQRLEQYEEALENIAFSKKEGEQQQELEFDEYIPKYFLQFETRESPTLVNTDAMVNPWNYRLNVWDGYTYDNSQAVDLIETFNYLIGLHIHKFQTKDFKGKRYQFVYGSNNHNKLILVVWRDISKWQLSDFETDGMLLTAELQQWTYDQLYINGQAHIADYQPIEEVFKTKMMN